MAEPASEPLPPLASPIFGEGEELDLSGLDEDMLISLLDDDADVAGMSMSVAAPATAAPVPEAQAPAQAHEAPAAHKPCIPPPPPPLQPLPTPAGAAAAAAQLGAPPSAAFPFIIPGSGPSGGPVVLPMGLAMTTGAAGVGVVPPVLAPAPSQAAASASAAVPPPILPAPMGGAAAGGGKKAVPLILPRGGSNGGGGVDQNQRPFLAPAPEHHHHHHQQLKRKASTASSVSSSSSLDGGGGDTAASLAAALAAMEEQGLDPAELKKQRRLIRNRMASQLHRDRQKARVDGLQAQIKERDEEIARLRQRLDALGQENLCFRTEVAALRAERDRLLSVVTAANANARLAAAARTPRESVDSLLGGSGGDDGGYTTSSSSSSASYRQSSGGGSGDSSASSSSAGSTPDSLLHGMEGGGGGGGSSGGSAGYLSSDDTYFHSSPASSTTSSPRFAPATAGTSTAPSGGGGGRHGGFPLFGALFLFTFLAAPSTLLLGLTRRAAHRGSNLGGFLPSSASSSDASSSMAGPLVAVSAIRDLALPFVGWSSPPPQSQKDSGALPPVLYGPQLPQPLPQRSHFYETVAGAGAGAGAGGAAGGEGYVFDPLERMPGKWRHLAQTGRMEGAPWKYSEAIEILSSSASSHRSGNLTVWAPAPVPAPAPVAAAAASSRLRTAAGGQRAKATLKDPSGQQVMTEAEARDGDYKQVDFYMGRTRDATATNNGSSRSRNGSGSGPEGEAKEAAAAAAAPSSTSYMFCPQAFGMMSPEVSAAYWRHVEAAFLSLPEGEQKAVKQRLLFLDQQKQQRQQNQTVASSSASSSDASADPHLLLLVPSRSVDWAGASSDPSAATGGGGSDWLEVGCRLTSMRVVSDVRFPHAT